MKAGGWGWGWGWRGEIVLGCKGPRLENGPIGRLEWILRESLEE